MDMCVCAALPPVFVDNGEVERRETYSYLYCLLATLSIVSLVCPSASAA